MWAIDYHKSIMNAELHGAAAHLAVDRWCGAPQGIDGDRLQESGAVQIGGGRGGAAVVVEAGETLLTKSTRTRMRAAGRPKKRWVQGAVVAMGDAWFRFRATGRSDNAVNGRPRGVQAVRWEFEEIGIRRGPHMVHDGWRATVATPLLELGWRIQRRTMRAATSSLNAPMPPSRRRFATLQPTA